MFGGVRHLLGSLGLDPDIVDVKRSRNPEREHIPSVRDTVDDSADRNPLPGIDLLQRIPEIFPQAVPDADQKFAPAPDPHGKGVALRAVRRNGHGLFDKGIEPGNPDVGIPGSRIPRPDFNRAGIPLIEPPLQRHGAGTVFPVFLQMLFDAGLPGLLKIAVLDDRAAFTERHRAMPGGTVEEARAHGGIFHFSFLVQSRAPDIELPGGSLPDSAGNLPYRRLHFRDPAVGRIRDLELEIDSDLLIPGGGGIGQGLETPPVAGESEMIILPVQFRRREKDFNMAPLHGAGDAVGGCDIQGFPVFRLHRLDAEIEIVIVMEDPHKRLRIGGSFADGLILRSFFEIGNDLRRAPRVLIQPAVDLECSGKAFCRIFLLFDLLVLVAGVLPAELQEQTVAPDALEQKPVAFCGLLGPVEITVKAIEKSRAFPAASERGVRRPVAHMHLRSVKSPGQLLPVGFHITPCGTVVA